MMRRIVAIAIFAGLLTLAWNPRHVTSTAAYRWDVSGPVVWNPDLGALGLLTNTEAIQEVDASFDTWESVDTATIAFMQGGSIVDGSGTPVDVTPTNYSDVLALNNGQNPIIFDDGNEILDLLGLPGVLGMGGPRLFGGGGEILKSYLMIGGAGLNGDPGDGELSMLELRGVIVHEIGHFINLGHSSVNQQLSLVDGPLPGCPLPANHQIETMAPYLQGEDFGTLEHDDIIGVSALYPTAAFTDAPRIRGTLYDRDGITPVNGGNIVVRPATTDCDALYEMAQTSHAGVNPGETGGSGTYEIPGLVPGTDYTLQAVSIRQGGTFPAAGTKLLSGRDDFFNASEDVFDPPDDPAESTPVTTGGAPSVVTDIDIMLNLPRGGGTIGTEEEDLLRIGAVGADTPLPVEVLSLGDGFSANFVGIAGTDLAWINRFTPDPPALPLRIEGIIFQLNSFSATAGRPLRLLVYSDPAATGDPANATLVYSEDVVVQFDMFFMSDYTLASPVTISTGEFYVGALDLGPPPSQGPLGLIDFPSNPTGRSYLAYGTTSPGAFGPLADTPVGDNTWEIRTRVATIPPPGSLLLTWGGHACEAPYPEVDFAVYEGGLASIGSTLDHAPVACGTGGESFWIAPPGGADRFWLVSPMLPEVEGTLGLGSSGENRTPAITCGTMSDQSCP